MGRESSSGEPTAVGHAAAPGRLLPADPLVRWVILLMVAVSVVLPVAAAVTISIVQ